MNRLITLLLLACSGIAFGQPKVTGIGPSAKKKLASHQTTKPQVKALILKQAKKKSEFQRIDSVTYYAWRSQVGEWVPEARLKFNHDNNGYPSLSQYFEDWGSGNFNLTYAIETRFDQNGSLLSSIYKEWDEFNKKWDYQYRDSSTYDQSGNVLEYLYQEYTNGVAINNYLSKSTFNAKGKLIKHTSAQWNKTTKSWVPMTVETLVYDNKDLLLYSLDSSWNVNMSRWDPSGKDTFEYDAKNRLVKQVNYAWNNGWKEKEQMTNTYNQNDRLMERVVAERNGTSWDSTDLSKYGYDANGNPNLEEYSAWENGQWKPGTRYEYVYDAVEKVNPIFLKLDIYLPDQDQHIVNLPLEEFDYVADGAGGWNKDYHEVYHYSKGGNAAIDKIEDRSVILFPNPAQNKVSWVMENGNDVHGVIVRSISGEEVLRVTPADKTIDVSELISGMYLVELNTDQGAYRTKLLVQ